MNIAQNILASLLALLLVNPACCCALNGCPSSDSHDPAPTQHSCCSAPTPDDSSEKPSPDDHHNCRCSVDQRVAENGKINLPCPSFVQIPEPLIILLPTDLSAPAQAIAPPAVEHHPPASPIRILFSIFRL